MEENKDSSVVEISKKLGDMWGGLKPEDKKVIS
jgi:hypothetical protein